ncbi:PadR family transcriptional regulator [Clostridium sp. WLY-B-L2]|uniref:PadR family transcriptional regulator n=1 Tax=Clostridium aromativorans TaxID=2836848 RepID=A0ABS8N9A3_9CLOT|nr:MULTISPECIES: PadR family transcriptional regulator [Clostridium]KAA8680567.1 PadR family transcriptional regulator [Clostridium sp. HV4-5-A1G]MCC9295293.1 PadR family transcriptional regulator [Clostridium aromativorans]CAB1261762.1 Transcriptional regulator, PadR family [Clostridiaceae bacterium BL-3]
MFDKSQLMRGTLEGCILKIISLKITYGYEIMVSLRNYGFSEIKEGTIYPLLIRLEKKNLIFGKFQPSPLGPSRKYYIITKKGREELKSFEIYWNNVSSIVKKILCLEGE